MAKGCHDLEKINMSRCSHHVTDKGVVAIAENCPRLREVILGYLSEVWRKWKFTCGGNFTGTCFIVRVTHVWNNGLWEIPSWTVYSWFHLIQISKRILYHVNRYNKSISYDIESPFVWYRRCFLSNLLCVFYTITKVQGRKTQYFLNKNCIKPHNMENPM